MTQFVACLAERGEALLLRPVCGRRVLEVAVMAAGASREDRALFVRRVAHRDDIVELTARELTDVLRSVRRDVDPDLAHHRNGFGPHV